MSGAALGARLWPAAREGGGRPAVLLHGFDGSIALFEDLAGRLAEARTVLALELPGFAGSVAFPGFGPTRVAAEAVAAAIDAHGLGRTHLVGHSLGAAVASLCALRAPGRFASLALVSPGGFGPEVGVDRIARMMRAEGPEALAAALDGMAAPGFRMDQGEAARLLAVRDAVPGGRAAAELVFARLFRDGRQGVLPLEALAGTGVPVTLLWGDRDPVTPFGQMAAAPAAFERVVLEGVGHMPMLEAPDRLAEALARVLAFRDDS